MKGRIAFWYRMRRQGENIVPEVLFMNYGQQCNRCQLKDEVFHPSIRLADYHIIIISISLSFAKALF